MFNFLHIKKITAIGIVLLFLIGSLPVITARPIPERPATETVTIYRYGLNGDITAIPLEILLGDGNSSIADVCKGLLDQDEEIQSFIENTNIGNMLSNAQIVISSGKGYHFKLSFPSLPRISTKMYIMRRLMQNPIVQIWHMFLIRGAMRFVGQRTGISPIIFCRYSSDDNASTVVAPFRVGEKVFVEGPHQVICKGFVGYTGWRFPASPLGHFIKQGFAGISLNTTVKMI